MLVDGAGGTNSSRFLFPFFSFLSVFGRFVGMMISRARCYDESSAEFPPAGEPASEKAIDLMGDLPPFCLTFWKFHQHQKTSIFRGLLCV